MGVPALFRWLSKKYPNIVLPVVEEEEQTIKDEAGNEIPIPINYSAPNPNGEEFDNLYLDMNGIVHPCTHPEGKPAPETEEEMMVEIFKYTERVVNMIRPRKLLMMAIDGVAPRAKMNQQRSRRFRSSQEAKDKEEARIENLKIWESMGKEITEDMKSKEAWDSNAITPGTPFMDLLAQSLRYWVVQKMNSDPSWKQLEVIISDATVPGEGEHKIMDYIRRQRVNPGHDPNTRHVIYGLDADLIMLSLATHEPHFRVLREDVFNQDKSPTACRTCGQEGHFAAQCLGVAKVKVDEHDTKSEPPAKKPFIFLDSAILREYLEIELDVGNAPFPFDLERAIDDWVLLIFFVGNDFLPHLPSLEIREGAIDTLLKIWKDELPRMGGYMTNHGSLEYARIQIILEGLARREDEIFRRRREAEERQDQNAKRRKLEAAGSGGGMYGLNGDSASVRPAASLQLDAAPSAPPAPSPIATGPHGLPPRPNFNSFETAANALGFGAPSPTASSPTDPKAVAIAAIGGSNSDWLANRREIRMANLSAAEMLKAEMMSAVPVNRAARERHVAQMRAAAKAQQQAELQAELQAKQAQEAQKTVLQRDPPPHLPEGQFKAADADADSVLAKRAEVEVAVGAATGIDGNAADKEGSAASPAASPVNGPTTELRSPVQKDSTTIAPAVSEEAEVPTVAPEANPLNEDEPIRDEDDSTTMNDTSASPTGVKRKIDELDEDAEGEDDEEIIDDEDDAPPDMTFKLKVNNDGTVEQEDTVKLWEPGYKERYYRQKFGVEPNDHEFIKKVTTAYIEGIAWVLAYYYQGTPSWNWYYPYHFAPFAGDFSEITTMDIRFVVGQPFKPFEQLMGVFPPASRKHIPETFHELMTEADSPIKDFYPETFQIDMNGKKMAWQGVALLPFIDEQRLLEAMGTRYPGLTEEEIKRNKWGYNNLYVADEHPFYPVIESLYAKRKDDKPVPIDPGLSKGINGSLLPDPNCIPGATYYSPLTDLGLEDIPGDRSLTALYFFPKQLRPHRSVLLPGVQRAQRTLTPEEVQAVRFGRRPGRGRDAGFHSINSNGGGRDRDGRRGTYGAGPGFGGRQSYGGYGQSNSYGARNADTRSGYGQNGSYNGRPNDRSYDRGPPPPPRGRGGPPRNSNYGPPASNYNRPPSNNYQSGSGGAYGDYRNGSHGGGYNTPPQSYGKPDSGYGGGANSRGGYGGYGGYGGDSAGYGGYGRDAGANRGSHGGYGGQGQQSQSSYGQNSSSYGGYGGQGGGYGGQGGQGAQSAQAPYAAYGGYGRGAPPAANSYAQAGRGRGYGRY